MNCYVIVYRDTDGGKRVDSIYTDRARAESMLIDLEAAEQKFSRNECGTYRIDEMHIDTSKEAT